MDDDPPSAAASRSTASRAIVGTAKAALVAVTLLFLSSMGGAMLFGFPVLVPLHWLAARTASAGGRIGWGCLAAASLFEGGWMLTYVLSGGNQPLSFSVGVLLGAAGGVAVGSGWPSRPRPASGPTAERES